VDTLAEAYDRILDANFESVPSTIAPLCAAGSAFCPLMESVALWWQIALEPDARRHDGRFLRTVERAIQEAERWTIAEPERAEAWFARGGAYSLRAQWRVLRKQRLAAARDGREIKDALERAVTLDPAMHDARFGLGLYRYYAGVVPAALRLFRWILRLPGGDREDGLRQMLHAYERGAILRGEAEYQLHLIYLWYEEKPREALALLERLQARHPRNPLFYLAEAHIHEVYLHDRATALRTLRDLVARAQRGDLNARPIALRRAGAESQALADSGIEPARTTT
jgi:tetratricopeptide (TPR) repeat protein